MNSFILNIDQTFLFCFLTYMSVIISAFQIFTVHSMLILGLLQAHISMETYRARDLSPVLCEPYCV